MAQGGSAYIKFCSVGERLHSLSKSFVQLANDGGPVNEPVAMS